MSKLKLILAFTARWILFTLTFAATYVFVLWFLWWTNLLIPAPLGYFVGWGLLMLVMWGAFAWILREPMHRKEADE